MIRRLLAAGAAVTISMLTVIPAEGATKDPCVRQHASHTAVMGKPAREVTVDAWATVCPSVTTVEGVAVTSAQPVRVKSGELWRYRYPGSRGAVRSAVLKVPSEAAPGVPVWVGRDIPTQRIGWAGFVRVVVVAGDEVRPVALTV